jgi:hypothetical protein
MYSSLSNKLKEIIMAWTVGVEEIFVGDLSFEGQWEVDASSEEEATNADLIPYLLVGRIEHADVPYPQVEWVASNELSGQETIYTGEHDEDDEPIAVLLEPEQVRELAHVMDRLSEDASLADFT